VQLATRDDLAVSAVTSDDGAVYELEVTLASAQHHDAVVIDRSQPGDHCQMTLGDGSPSATNQTLRTP
jgi:hypothetical protein